MTGEGPLSQFWIIPGSPARVARPPARRPPPAPRRACRSLANALRSLHAIAESWSGSTREYLSTSTHSLAHCCVWYTDSVACVASEARDLQCAPKERVDKGVLRA